MQRPEMIQCTVSGERYSRKSTVRISDGASEPLEVVEHDRQLLADAIEALAEHRRARIGPAQCTRRTPGTAPRTAPIK